MFAIVIGILISLLGIGNSAPANVTVIPPMPNYAPTYAGDSNDDDLEWFMFHVESERDAFAEFTAVFNSYECKWSKNGRLMIRKGDSGSFRFVKRSA